MLDEQARAMTALGAPRYAVLARIEATPDPIGAWTGPGWLPIAADDVELTGMNYQGVGLLGDIPPLRQLIAGVAERLELSLMIAGGPLLELLDEDADAVIGAPVDLGVVFFDDEWQMVAPPAWLWHGTADMPGISRSTGPDGTVTRGVSLSVGSAFTDRSRSELAYYTDADQRRRSATDRFCERTLIYTENHTISWL